jgi:hypothetical protein
VDTGTGISLLPQRLMGILTRARSAVFGRRDGWRNISITLKSPSISARDCSRQLTLDPKRMDNALPQSSFRRRIYDSLSSSSQGFLDLRLT